MVSTAFTGTKALSTYYTQIACCRSHDKVTQNMLFTGYSAAKLHCTNPTKEFFCSSAHESRHTYAEKKWLQEAARGLFDHLHHIFTA